MTGSRAVTCPGIFWMQNNRCYDIIILDKEKALNLREEVLP